MPDIKIQFSGTLTELEPLMVKFKAMGIQRMDEAETMDEAHEIWKSFQPWQRSKEFIEAKERAKKRITGDGTK